jgi:rSAM/selenodomain-associated transferase 1
MADKPAAVLLIQFARAPVPGQVKTRMIPHLTPQQACDLHSELVLRTCRQLLASQLGETELSVAGDVQLPLFQQCRALGIGRISQQQGHDLGQRMFRAIHAGLQAYERVLLVGSDCPAIDRAYLAQALQALERAPVVLGPAMDGGYVLFGATRVSAQWFEGIEWGSSRVFSDTVQKLRESGAEWLALPELADVDRPEDIPAWERLKSGDGCSVG